MRASDLDKIMEFDYVIRVKPDGTVTDAPGEYAPEVTVELDDDGQITDLAADPFVEGWDLMAGYTGQYGYHGAIMHSAEYIGGEIAADILSRPGLYVVTEVTGLYPSEESEKADSDNLIGWVVCYKLDEDA